MTLQELQNQVLKLPISDRWHLVQSVLSSIQQETLSTVTPTVAPNLEVSLSPGLDPWTQGLMGVINLVSEDPTESYIDYLEEKYSTPKLITIALQ